MDSLVQSDASSTALCVAGLAVSDCRSTRLTPRRAIANALPALVVQPGGQAPEKVCWIGAGCESDAGRSKTHTSPPQFAATRRLEMVKLPMFEPSLETSVATCSYGPLALLRNTLMTYASRSAFQFTCIMKR